jgi:hypothetical protein
MKFSRRAFTLGGAAVSANPISSIYFGDLSPPKSQRSVSSHFSQKYTGSDLLRESIIGPVQLGHSGLSIATGGTLE